MTRTVPEIVQDRCIEIAALPTIEQPPAIHDLWNDFRSHGYTKGNIRELVVQVQTARQEEQMVAQSGELIDEMNNDYFVMQAESKVRIGTLNTREINGHEVQGLNMMSQADFGTLMANRIVAGETADKIWLAHPQRRQYSGFFTHPDKPVEHNGKLNLWGGFSVEPKRGSIKRLVKHIGLLVGGDEDCVEYVMNWIAAALQRPGDPVGVVIVLIGEQGTGKGILGNGIRSIFGQHGIRIGTQNELVGKHNKQLLSACFAFLDEALFAGNRQVADVLKGLVTEPTIRVEPKFQDSYEVDNMLTMLAASNHDHAMQIEFSDRRYCVFGVPDKVKEMPRSYWKDMATWMQSKEGKAAILWHMLRRDLSDWNAEDDRPMTSFYLDQKLSSLQNDWLWWRCVAEQETWQIGRAPVDMGEGRKMMNGGREYEKVTVYKAYCKWAEEQPYHRQVPASVFWRNAQKWLLDADSLYRTGSRGNQVRVVCLPSFDEINQRLEGSLARK